jgi:hypothetical protein
VSVPPVFLQRRDKVRRRMFILSSDLRDGPAFALHSDN